MKENQPNGEPTNGAAAHGPAAVQQSASAQSGSGASSPGAAPPPLKPPLAPQRTAVPATPTPKVSAQGNTAGKQSVATAPTANKPKLAAEVKDKGPAEASSQPKIPPRPYFVSKDTVLESFPEEIQVAYDAIVGECNKQMVMAEPNAMAKAIGGAFAMETAMGIFVQHQLMGAVMSGASDIRELESLMSRHDKGVKRQERLANLLLRFKTLQAKQGPLGNQP